jgi:hypothetical protein
MVQNRCAVVAWATAKMKPERRSAPRSGSKGE